MALSSENSLDWLQNAGAPKSEPFDEDERAETPPKTRARRERQAAERQQHRERTKQSKATRDAMIQELHHVPKSGEVTSLGARVPRQLTTTFRHA